MTSSEMVAEIRMLIDESQAGFWTDDDIYIALSTAQQTTANYLLKKYENNQQALDGYVMQMFANYFGQTADGVFILPSDIAIMKLIKAEYGANGVFRFPCIVSSHDENSTFNDMNVFMAPMDKEPIVRLSDAYGSDGSRTKEQRVEFKPSPNPTYGTFNLWYIGEPLPINADTDALMHRSTHRAIVFGAYAELLHKKEINNEAARSEYNGQLEIL